MNIPVLALLAAGLAGMIVLELQPQPTDDNAMPALLPSRSSLASSGASLAGALGGGMGPEAAAAVLARPLFATDRRPPPATLVAATAQAPLPRVTGILIEGQRRSVMFAAATEGARPVVLSEGEDINGFRVQSIEPAQVTLTGPEGPRTLRPSFTSRPADAAGQAGAVPGGPVPSNLDTPAGIPGLPSLPGLPGLPAGPNAR